MKILNLYAGIGGNRTLWGDEHEITAIEINSDIASEYKYKFPNDEVIQTDSHQFLLHNYQNYDFIWSSPPCPSHSRLCYSQKEKRYAEMSLYQQIILLKSWFKGKYAIENVVPYYDYLIQPSIMIGRHPYWTNFKVEQLEVKNIDVSRSTKEELSEYLGIPIPRINGALLLRNSVEPNVGKHILDCALKSIENNNSIQCTLL
ncbi:MULTISPECIES: DNA cytosine methyltransferase [unclassified Flavobacterium]|uniref:DNA cytosine methyltransferase n=1 Tax=unclassified Flavobacterium TaxID=196869 RepID=UPI001291230D|nr:MULTISPECIES: DNA cytosine methyltransferase [unclassified Flavobacterium]MQP53706.1 DNA cytosine methyltransferase [Flavobacterium sp. LMO9]MQP63620.1 DNA cytosine methyltransferase [Flavobacterium sp. LMO6]